jgi:hypothetical protein
MRKVQTNVSTSRSPQEVYDYLVDFENQAEWRFDVLDSRLVQGEKGRVGARYRQRTKQGRREMEILAELTQADAPRTVAFSHGRLRSGHGLGRVEHQGAWRWLARGVRRGDRAKGLREAVRALHGPVAEAHGRALRARPCRKARLEAKPRPPGGRYITQWKPEV